jgi:hypothetical protein
MLWDFLRTNYDAYAQPITYSISAVSKAEVKGQLLLSYCLLMRLLVRSSSLRIAQLPIY